ncbi:MAG: hypothetical protein ACYC7J_20095 [Syntrophales bacterium]
MAVSGKYGNVDIPKIAAEEPVFILRAQDALAATAIGMYQLLAESHGRPLAGELAKQIESFKKWQGNRKMPD